MYGNEAEDPFQTYLGRAQVGLTEFGGAMDAEDSLDGDFCTPANLPSSIQYINNTLDAFGFHAALPIPPSLPATPSSTDTMDIGVEGCVQLVNTLYSVLQRHQKDVDFRSEAADRIRSLQAAKEQAVSSTRRWEERASAVERELSFLSAKEKKAEDQLRRMKDKYDLEKEESTRQIASLQHRDSQAQHEIRKKEREYNRLQERLQHMLNERNREAKAGMDMLQTIQREGKKRAGWKMQGGKNVEDEMYKMIITTYENKQQELVEESNGLRNSLRDLQTELQQLLNEHQQTKNTKRIHSDAATTPTKPSPHHLSPSPPTTPLTSYGHPNEEFLSGQFDLPYSLVRETVEERIRAQMQRYRDVMSNKDSQVVTEKPPPAALQKQWEDGKKTIEECKKIIEEQNELVQYLLKFSQSTTPLPLSPSSPPLPSLPLSADGSQPPASSSPPHAQAQERISPAQAQDASAQTSSSPARTQGPSAQEYATPTRAPPSTAQTYATPTHAQPTSAYPFASLAHARTQGSTPARTLFPLYPNTPGVFRGMEDSRDELAERVFEKERELFEEQKKNFDEERKKVAEMALEIAKERLELQELKQQLLHSATNGSLSKPPSHTYTDTSLSESFINELEQVTLQNSMDSYFKSVDFRPPPSPISYKRQ